MFVASLGLNAASFPPFRVFCTDLYGRLGESTFAGATFTAIPLK